MSASDRFGCEDAFRRLDDYLDRELTPEEIALVRQHLETCATCAAEFTFEASVIACVRRKVQRIAMPPGLLGRISAKLAASDEPSPGS